MGLRSALAVAGLMVAAVSCASEPASAPSESFDTLASRALPSASDTTGAVGYLSLPDVSNNGDRFSFIAPDSGLLVVYFGFTSCPDVCPTTLADLKTALADLGEEAASVEVAMITVDPERDTTELLVDYVQWFVPDARALRTMDEAELQEVGDAFGADFSIVKTGDDGVEVLHTAYLYGVDATGSVVATWPFGVEPGTLSSDMTKLLG